VDFEKGHSAIVELSRQLLEVAKFTDLARGITVNPGVINGGTRTNVVAAEATAEVDIRVARAADAAELEQKFAALRPFDPACSLEVSGGLNRPPMPFDETMKATFEKAATIAARLGMSLKAGGTGGASDGNFVAPLGIPVLDGMGAVGEGGHSEREFIFADSVEQKARLIASLIHEW